MDLNAHYKRNKSSHGDALILKNQTILTNHIFFTSIDIYTYIEFNINKKNHIRRTFDSNIIKSATLILLLKMGQSRTIDRSRFWRVFIFSMQKKSRSH